MTDNKNQLNTILERLLRPDPIGFDDLGLLAERNHDGVALCNIPILGGIGGLYVAPDWGRPCTPAFLLSLSMLVRLMSAPHNHNPSLPPLLSKKMLAQPEIIITLDDGARIKHWQAELAKHFSFQHIESGNTDTLSMTLPTIVKHYAQLSHKLYPEDGA